MGHRDTLLTDSIQEPGHRSGEGSTTARVQLENDHIRTSAGSEAAGATRARHVILVVDDNEAMRYATSRALRALGFPVIEAASGSEGLALASAASAVVLDIRLPDLDGFEVCRRLRLNRTTDRLPIIHFTAMPEDEVDRNTSKEVGADEFVPSSLPPARLAELLDDLIGLHSSE